jgi:DNA primase
VAQASAAISPEAIAHTGLRRMLVELYSMHAAGLMPDMDILRERLHDRPDLYDAAERCREIGKDTSEPEQNLERILGWFARQKTEAEQKALTAKLKGDSLAPEEAVDLLRKLQANR